MEDVICGKVNIAFFFPCSVSKLSVQLRIKSKTFQNQHEQGSKFYPRDVFAASPINNGALDLNWHRRQKRQNRQVLFLKSVSNFEMFHLELDGKWFNLCQASGIFSPPL